MVERSKIVEAINLLIACDRYAKLVNELTGILENWDRHPMAYAGKLSPLNALLDVGLESREAFEKLIKLVEAKRKQLPKQRRQDYQRDLMAARRARLAKAIDLEVLLHGEMDTDAKAKFIKAIHVRWAEARDKFIKAKGELTWEQRNAASQQFWQAIDEKLDANLAYERKKSRGLKQEVRLRHARAYGNGSGATPPGN